MSAIRVLITRTKDGSRHPLAASGITGEGWAYVEGDRARIEAWVKNVRAAAKRDGRGVVVTDLR